MSVPKIIITTDTHFFHRKMEELCGRPKDFEIRIFKALQNVLQPEDILIHLGDIVLSSGQEEKAHDMFIRTLPGRKWLVRGNHDRKSNHWYLRHGWDFVADSFCDRYFGKLVCFSHVPMADTGYDINYHGHFHNTAHRNHEPGLVAIANNKQVLLALEYNNYAPWNLDTLINHPEKYNNK